MTTALVILGSVAAGFFLAAGLFFYGLFRSRTK